MRTLPRWWPPPPRHGRLYTMASTAAARASIARPPPHKPERVINVGVLFVNIVQRGTTWHATSAWEAHVARLGSQMNHLTKFRDPDARFESLGTYLELRDKFGDLACNLLFSKCTHHFQIL